MPRLISGSTLRRGGSGEFIDLKGAMPQLPPTETTATGFTLVTDSLLRTSYRSSLGFVEFYTASMYSSLPEGTIRILATGTSFASLSTETGTLVVSGGVGVGANMHVRDDITVNSLLIGQGYANYDDGAYNNIVIRGTATNTINDFSNGQNSVAIGYDTLMNLNSSYRSIAIGRYALSSGTYIRNSIAIGDSALKENGVVYERFILPITSATIKSSKTITNITNALPAVVTVTGHGLTTGSRISIYNVEGLSTGTFSWVNGQSFYIDKLTDDTFSLYNDTPFNGETALDTRAGTSTVYISSGTLVYPLEITVPNNDYTTGTAIQLTNLFDGLNEIDFYVFYTYPLGSNTFQLYTDNILSEGLDGTNLTPYVSGGTSTRVLLSNNNIAIGTNAGKSLFDGERNFFLGDYVAQNLTTGSYNFFIGHEVGNNLTNGSGNVSIMGDNLVDGRDNQVNIGGIFYYDGQGYLQLNADTSVGLGSTATTQTAALSVLGGVFVSSNVITQGPVLINSTEQTTATTNGALIVAGGAGISGDVFIGGQLRVEGPEQVNLNPDGANVNIQPQNGGDLNIFPQTPGVGNIDNTIVGATLPKEGYFTNLRALSDTNSVSTDSGALVVRGGAGIGKDLYVGGTIYGNIAGGGSATTATNIAGGSTGSLVYQIAPSTTGFIAIGGTGTILLSDGTNPYWATSSILSGTATNSDHVFVKPVEVNSQYFLGLTNTITNYSTVTSDTFLAYDTTDGTLTVPKVSITSTTASTSTNSNQALLVAGGIASGSIRTPDGQIDEDYLLYTPRVTISTSTPLSPRIGDFWIDPNYGVELQYIKDGTSTIWIQFTGF